MSFIIDRFSGFVFFLFWSSVLLSQNTDNFMHLPIRVADGNDIVAHSVQDSLGFVWLAHVNGISRYDGYTSSFIPKDSIFKLRSTHDQVKKLFKDGSGTIWVLSENGQLFYMGDNSSFLPIDRKIPGFQDKYTVNLVYPNDKKMWLATHQGSILSYDQISGTVDSITTAPRSGKRPAEINAMVAEGSDLVCFSTFLDGIYTHSGNTKEQEKLELPADYMQDGANTILQLDAKGRLWIGSTFIENDLLVFDFDKNTFVQDNIFSLATNKVPNELFISIYRDSEGIIWLGTDGNGLYKINPETGEKNVYTHNGSNKFSLSSNTVISINEDSHKNLWVLTNYGNINILRRNPNPIAYHSGSLNNGPARILSSCKATDGTLWVGTDGKGIMKISPNGTQNQFLTDINENEGFYIQSITEDSNNNIWVGTYRNGLWVYDPKEKRFSKQVMRNSGGQNVQDVRYLFKDSNNRIWAATGLGLYLYSDKETRLAFFENNSRGLMGVISQSIVQDKDDTIWVAYDEGRLFKFEENLLNLSASRFHIMDLSNDRQIEKKEKSILSMAFDGNETIWCVDDKGQVANFNTKSHKYTQSDTDAFKNIYFSSVLVEDENALWLGSKNGLWRYNIKDAIMQAYYKSDGFQDNSYLRRSANKDSNGYLYFGGIAGLNYFRPNEIKKKPLTANLLIEEIEIPNGPVTSIFPQKGSYNKLKLNYRQSSFSFRFLAIDNVLFPNFEYAYRLKGFNDKWSFSDKERIATYTNIPPGDYIFEVKAGIKNGKWDIGQKALAVSITPPIWKTIWAYLFYSLLVVGLLYGVVTWTKLRNRLLAEKLMHEHDKEIFALKIDFFAKMSHEIQTPLTLILVPLDQMMKNALKSGNGLLQDRLHGIANNAKRLSRIVFELTSLRDKEMEKLCLRPSKNDFVLHLKEIAGAFEEQANFRGIDFKCDYPSGMRMLNYDAYKMEHIIYNLLSNAFKFTPKNGAVSMDVAVEEWERRIKISITDSGPGIPKEELEHIFRLFYQTDSGKQKNGTGIGLALTKELVDLHGGTIHVKSDPKKGTCFRVCFPMDKEAMPHSSKERETYQPQFSNNQNILKKEQKPIEKKFNKTLLIVEDNYELQISLRDIFNTTYNVLLAENGEEGCKMTQNHKPDLVISDIMMPKMNGIEMVYRLQKNRRTAHIPIVLLTAKKDKKDKIAGLRSGALEYIGKPFSPSELVIKVNNILTRGDRLMAKYKNDMLNLPKNVGERSRDDIFLENVIASIEAKMGNPEFKLDELADDLRISYSALFRKFQSLTGKTLVDFVRAMRLKKAYLLISEADYAIAQAAFSVGFNDPKYFSKCFKKEFGKTPNTIKREVKQQAIEVFDQA